jgi:hypothetical protein
MVSYQQRLAAHAEMLGKLVTDLNELKRLRELVKKAELHISRRTVATVPRYRAGADRSRLPRLPRCR